MSIRAQLRICEVCRQPAIVQNGIHQTALEFKNIDGKAVVMPHTPDCERVIG